MRRPRETSAARAPWSVGFGAESCPGHLCARTKPKPEHDAELNLDDGTEREAEHNVEAQLVADSNFASANVLEHASGPQPAAAPADAPQRALADRTDQATNGHSGDALISTRDQQPNSQLGSTW